MTVSNKVVWVIAFALFVFSSFFSYSFFSSSIAQMRSPLSSYETPKGNGNGSIEEPQSAEPKTEECPINGEMLTKTQSEKWKQRRPMGIMIENHKDSRPQSGVSSADVVYEAVAEGGITRFLAIYYCKDASYVGPVRSARIYFIRMLQEYGEFPLYGHVGGANCDSETGSGCANGAQADALGQVRKLGWALYNDMNQFAVPFPYYWRDYERLPNRATEHTVYSSTAKLWQYAKEKRSLSNIDEKGTSWDKTYTSWKFKDDEKQQERGDVMKISLGFWNAFASDFGVTWMYDKIANNYKRENGGEPHIDKNTGKPIRSKNIIILFAKESPANDGYEGGHILYKLIGSGDALVFQDGKSIVATWTKQDNESRTILSDKSGKEISFTRGQIFFEILPIGNKVTY